MSHFQAVKIKNQVDEPQGINIIDGVVPVSAGILESLIETLQELTARLNLFAGMANAGAPALRIIPIASVSTAVTGTVTASGPITNAQFLAAMINQNQTSLQSNINNVVGV